MRFYFAPMEGITRYQFRNAYSSFFGGIDTYYAPFISPTQSRDFSHRELTDIAPENNVGINVVPQILTNDAKKFLVVANKLKAVNYNEVNLNLGCPSGTVVTKKKGAGFLADLDKLNDFLQIITKECDVPISIKTRLGMSNADEFREILNIFNEYPLEKIIVHPRTREDFYGGTPDWDMFAYALECSKNKVCYNGDIFTVEDYERLTERFPQLEQVMIGRGLLRNPGLIDEIVTGKKMSMETLFDFHEQLYSSYKEMKLGEKNTLFKMKELWTYLQYSFNHPEKEIKQIKKAVTYTKYEMAVAQLF